MRDLDTLDGKGLLKIKLYIIKTYFHYIKAHTKNLKFKAADIIKSIPARTSDNNYKKIYISSHIRIFDLNALKINY